MSGHKQNLHILYISFKTRKNESLLHIFFYQSKDQFNYWSKCVNIKNGKFHCFEDANADVSTCCQRAIMKSEFVKFVIHKKMLIFLCNTKMIFFLTRGYIFDDISKTPTRKIPTHQTPPPGKFPPGKFPSRKFPPGIFPLMFLNIPTRVFNFFVFSLLSPSSLILLKRLFSNSMF